MRKNSDEVQKLGTDNMKMAMKSFGVMSKGFQVLAAEIADYSKRSLEDHTAAMNRLMTGKTMQQTFEVQSEYVKTAYEAFVAQAPRIGELYADLAKESCEPFEGILREEDFGDLMHTVRDCALDRPCHPTTMTKPDTDKIEHAGNAGCRSNAYSDCSGLAKSSSAMWRAAT